jgi:hypothetical protein
MSRFLFLYTRENDS